MQVASAIAASLFVAVGCGGPLSPEGPPVSGQWEADTSIGLIRLDLTESNSGKITGSGAIRGRDVLIEDLSIAGRHEARRVEFEVVFPHDGAEASFDGVLDESDRFSGEWVFSHPPNVAGDRFEMSFLRISDEE